ncbi:MAG: PAS/PAC sensor hybrid histidine kinase [Marinimicrobia bacterium 46_43]|nr:MAG: PAS/PAC sensor hybrid histidine kinase [Marinimicrobia bacterium 46_43]HBY19040.1 hypothetical protein [Candidatus Neomarinimicrobiota bacterium]
MTKRRILIVEDERIIAEDLRVTLESFGYEVIDIISSGEKAIKKAGETLPDLILMDIVLEGEMRGSEAAEIIHRKYNTPIIFLTAYADENTLQMAKASEPYGYLIKPFEERELQATIEMFFYKINLEKKLESSELRLRSLFEKAHDGIIIIDEQKHIIEINKVAIRISGYTQNELLKKEYQDILPDLDLHTIRDEETKSHVVETFILNQNKDHIPVEISYSSYSLQNEQFIMLVFRDISERIRNREILERRNQILEAVGVVAEQLLSSDQIDKAINESLKHIGEATSADRCYIFKNVLNPQNELCMSQKYEWAHETVAPQLNNDLLQNMPYAVYDDIYTDLSQNKIYHKIARDFNEAEKAILVGQDIQSLVLVPISVDNTWWGFIGLDDCHKEKEWAPAEIEALKVVAGTIGAAIQNFNARINIQKTEDKYRLLVESINDGIVISQNGEFIFYNNRFAEILGYEPEELQNINYRKIYSRRGLEILMERFEKRQLGEKVPDRYETYFLKKDGKEIDVEVNVSIIEYEENPASFAVIRDITEQKKAINEILKLSRALEQSSSSIIITDINSDIEYVNPRFTEVTGYSKEDVLGKKMSYLKSGVNPEDTYQEMWKTIIRGENWYGELHNRRKDGTLFWEKVSISPIRDNDGQITHYVAIRDDITDQKQKEEELRESEEKLRAITDSASDGIVMVDHKARIVFWNPSAEKIFGYTADEILGKNFFHTVVPQKYKETFDTQSFNGKFPDEMLGSGFEINITRKDHKEIPIEASFSSVRLRGHWNTIAIIRDISERKQAEQEINLLAHAIKSISEAVSVTDLNDRILFVNNAFIKTYGYTRDELIGKHINLIRTDEMMNDHVLLESIRNETLGGGGWQGEVLNRRKDGKVFPVMLSTSLLHDENGVPQASIGVARDISERKQSEKELYQSRERLNIILHSIGNGVVVIDSEDRVIIYNEKARELLNLSDPLEPIPHVRDILIHCEHHGKVLLDSLDIETFSNLELIVTEPDHRILYVTGTTFEDVDGQSAGKVFILRDVTKEREIDRMKTDFVSSVSHELRTPLTSIMGFSNTILRKEKIPEEMKKEFVEIIYNESKRLARLIEDVLSISKIESGKITFEMKPLNLDEVIQDAVTIYRTQAEDKQIDLTYEKDEKLPEILGDRDAMSQVIGNLINNALKFTPSKGIIDVRLKHKNHQIVLDVEDNGMGIPKNEQDKIFQKFYRIHRPGTQIQGTGLGLSIVMEIIEKHKGKIEVFSEENKGSLFRISLPVFEK